MRKTSQDGADSTSIGSGLDNELKKPSTSTNKVKKNSIKRKVPNFSHDSDDAIIEPLLQTEKDNSVIANKSAKYLLNKSKTESMCEKDAKPYEKAKISSPSSISNNIASTVEKRTSPLTSESPPIYNHMNTNVFSGYDLTKEKTTTASSSVLVEIDGCKIVSQGSNPVIFTTAKIHADNKTKAIEPVPVTTVPILSTIEGNIVKSGVIYEDNKRYNVSQTNKGDITKNVNIKSDLTLESSNFNNQPNAKVTPTIPLTSMHIKNEQNKNKELKEQSAGSSEQSEKLFSKDQKVSLGKVNTNTSDERSLMPKVTCDDKITTKAENTTYKSNGVLPDTSKELLKSSNKPSTLNKSNIVEKIKPSSDVEKISTNQSTTSSTKQSSKSNVSPQSDQTDSSKNFSSSIKKLQRQKNAMMEEAVETGKKDLVNSAKDKPCTVQNIMLKDVTTAVSVNTKTIQKPVTSLTKVAITCAGPKAASELPSKSINTTVLTPAIKSPLITPGTSTTLTTKPSTSADTAKAKSTSTKIPETSGKLATKPSLNITTVTMAPSTKTSTASSVKSMKVTDDPTPSKQDSSLVSTSSSKIHKAETTPTSSVATTLPLYIVSTSKTKIGSSSTPSISNVTKKTLDQKPITEVVSTANGKSGKALMSTSSSQNCQSGSKPKTSTVNLVKKDDRA
ncbi:mucin-2-like isoform X1 [Danaus plexippus]|uniref:mucin-2-like isoform X1 n=1 Tax=Danaus plexippus TaxID=13037 RepID=UPI002AB0EECA|nr:mucin-2-like isoform X1 [Danaus plexippus]